MLWIIVAILSYFFSAIVALFDKYLLVAPIPSPKVYSFYVGILGICSLILIPFVNFLIPDSQQILLSLLSGALFIYSLFWYCSGLRLFETSRIVPVIGGLNPIFIFSLTCLFGQEIFDIKEGLAFILLIAGSIFITLQREKFITLKSLQFSAIAALLFSLAFFIAKFIYLVQPFWSGFIWMRIGGFIAAITLFFSKEVKEELFKKRVSFKKRTAGIFILGQFFGAGSMILQNWAIALVPFAFLAFVNVLEGTKYVFLLIFVTLLSLKFPEILKEQISKKILLQKISAILLIGGGLVLLAFK